VDADTTAVKNAQAALTAAQLRVHASTEGSGEIGQAVSTNKLDAVSVQAVASAVQQIVHEIVSTSFSEESCLQYFKAVSEGSGKPIADMAAFCNALLTQKKETLLAKAVNLEQARLKLSITNAGLQETLNKAAQQSSK
jgi:hypothetical protein